MFVFPTMFGQCNANFWSKFKKILWYILWNFWISKFKFRKYLKGISWWKLKIKVSECFFLEEYFKYSMDPILSAVLAMIFSPPSLSYQTWCKSLTSVIKLCKGKPKLYLKHGQSKLVLNHSHYRCMHTTAWMASWKNQFRHFWKTVEK